MNGVPISQNRKTCYTYGFAFLFLVLMPFFSYSQQAEGEEEIIISIEVQNVGITEMPAIINGEKVYLPVADIFEFLKIKNSVSEHMDSVTGFFLSEEAPFIVDKVNNRIKHEGKIFELHEDELILSETGLYLRLDKYGEIFGLDCHFNFRALLVKITTKLELPVIREARLEFMRKNINKLKGEIKVDTVLPRRYPMFHFGMVDWSIISNQQIGGLGATRYNLGLGGILAGGEVNAFLNYTNNQPFTEKRQFYMWRYVNNEHKALRQVNIGKISTITHSSIFAPIVGIQLSNTPTLTRQSFGSYTITNVTEPGWIVELYVNSVLVDYQKADASGIYTFNVPLVYGSSTVKLKFYGPFGEERSRQENVNVPYNFLPVKKFEYNISSGVVEDDSFSKFSRLTTNYGLSKRITVGSGVEYLSSVTSGATMPFVNTSARLGSGLMMSGEYVYSVKKRASLSYRRPSNAQVDIRYTQFDKNQTAINIKSLEERRISLSLPFQRGRFSLFSLLSFTQNILATAHYDNMEWLLTGVVNHTGVHLNTYGIFVENSLPYIYSDFSLVFRLPRGLAVTPLVQYEYTRRQLISLRALVEKHALKHGYVSLTMEQNFKSNFRSIGLQMRYEFQFAQVANNTRVTNNGVYLLEAANGSIYFDKKTKTVGTTSGTNIGKGGAIIIPYLDLNCNGNRDAGEPKVSGLKFTVTNGRVLPESKDTTIRVMNLEPYTNCYLELNRFSFDNIAWQIKNRSLKFTVEPNRFKPIEVPIAVLGEVSGMVYIDRNGIRKGQGQVYVCIYKNDVLVNKILSEPDGYFSYIGLSPGPYKATLDEIQLQKINMDASNAIPFNIIGNKEGDIVEGLEFVIKSKNTTKP